jgi:hypothetical protein
MEEMKKLRMMELAKEGFMGDIDSPLKPLNVDSILDKIYAHGLHSLNNNEKEFLKKQKK